MMASTPLLQQPRVLENKQVLPQHGSRTNPRCVGGQRKLRKTFEAALQRSNGRSVARQLGLTCHASSLAPAEPGKTKLGFVGIGVMGLPMVRCYNHLYRKQPAPQVLLPSHPSCPGRAHSPSAFRTAGAEPFEVRL